MRNLVFLLLVAVASAKVYTMCDWAKMLKANDMDGQGGHSLADWVCVSEGESSYNTRAVNKKNRNRSIDYGIFQINSHYWCDNGQPRPINGCNIRCSDLLTDDGTLSINCAKRVVRDPNGIGAWDAWRDNCDEGNHGFISKLAECVL